LQKLTQDKGPNLVFLSETRRKDFEMNFFRNWNGFSNIFAVSCAGNGRERSGGLACMWKSEVDVTILSFSSNHIDMLVKLTNDDVEWRCTGLYGFPETANKHKTCDLINHLANSYSINRWLIMGDFNLVLNSEEKQGGRNLTSNTLINLFRDTLQNYNLSDLGYVGDPYTWCNKQDGEHNIKARLDRCVATPDWLFSFPSASVTNLVRYASDHMPILLRLQAPKVKRRNFNKPRRFEQCWMRDNDFEQVVRQVWSSNSSQLNSKIPYCVEEFTRWGDDRFGNVPKKIRELQKQLEILNSNSDVAGNMRKIKEVEATLDDLFESEEIWWAQRSRAVWLQHGDRNTKFFHQKACQRKSRNWVDVIYDEYGEKISEEEDIARIFTEFFQNLFTSSEPSRIDEAVNVVQGRVTERMRGILNQTFSREEVFVALKSMKPTAAPGPDGMPAIFYQKYWHIVGDEISFLVLNVLNNGGDLSNLNHTFLCLIPKKKKPTLTSEFRPISLCNVIYKVITKVIANRLKLILPDIIDTSQSAFVPGRLITDNALIAFEAFHYMRKKTTGRKGYVGMKLDMSKAYDRIEWPFLKEVLNSMGFPQHWISLIMNCVSTVSFSVLLNGGPCQSFLAHRGLRQGDPLSPYLFILCAEVFSGLISRAIERNTLHGIQIARGAPVLSHLFFADDSLIFCRANQSNAASIQSILQLYQDSSGQLVNLDKSEISYSRNVPNEKKIEFQRWIPFKAVETQSKYLGLPSYVGRSKKQVFDFIQERVWKKLKGWKEKFLSSAGREVLIKSVVQSIPTYIMSCFLLPIGLCEHIESMIKQFWWGYSKGEKKKFHWINWNKCCQPKKSGGMGFRNIKDFNLALLAKQGWRILSNPDSLLARCLKARYFPSGNLLKASLGHIPSYTWRSIQGALWILNRGCLWRVGTGHFINIWEDNWLPLQNGYKVWSPKPPNSELSQVSQLIHHDLGIWNASLVNATFLPFEAMQILQLPLPTSTHMDSQIWGPNKNGIFSVKSAYHSIRKWEEFNISQTSTRGANSECWSKLWNIRTIPKHIHLAWRIFHDSLPTKKKLIHRGMLIDPLCSRCGNADEDLDHVFKGCIWAKKVWFHSPLGVRIEDSPLSFISWLDHVISHSPSDVISYVLSLCYGIWFARNKSCFDGKQNLVEDIVRKAWAIVDDYNLMLNTHVSSDNPEPSNSPISWNPPPPNCYKVNVDAAGPTNNMWGIGVVIRDSYGDVAAAATWIVEAIPDPDVGEALGVRLAIQFALDMGFFQVMFESDSLNVVRGFHKLSNNQSYLGMVVADCNRLSSRFNSFSLSHIKRSANMAAHSLAKFALTSSDTVWIEECPPCIVSSIAADLVA
jgi:ribonuclease HI